MSTTVATKVSVTTAATALIPAALGIAGDPADVVISIPTGGQTVYVGGADVDSTNGFPLPSPQTPLTFRIKNGRLYGIVTATTQNVNVLI